MDLHLVYGHSNLAWKSMHTFLLLVSKAVWSLFLQLKPVEEQTAPIKLRPFIVLLSVEMHCADTAFEHDAGSLSIPFVGTDELLHAENLVFFTKREG